MNDIKKVSIIGRGDFAKLIDQVLPQQIERKLYGSDNTIPNIKEIAQSDCIVLSIPFSAYQNVLEELAKDLNPGALIIDVCSTKVEPAKTLHQLLPNHKNFLITHPLFGPQSYKPNGNNVLVITEELGVKAKQVKEFCDTHLKLKVIEMSNQEHDKRMAEIHVLTFFIGRALSNLELSKEPFMTPSFQKILDLVDLDKTHTEALFQTIQKSNPYGEAERQKFIDELIKINNELSS